MRDDGWAKRHSSRQQQFEAREAQKATESAARLRATYRRREVERPVISPESNRELSEYLRAHRPRGDE